jgi:hypothetical protein
MKAQIPRSPEELNGPFDEVDEQGLKVLGVRDKAVLVEFHSLPFTIEWFDEFELMFGQVSHDRETIKVIRRATDDERRLFRVPLWIQSEETPECCGRPMHFIGQIDGRPNLHRAARRG